LTKLNLTDAQRVILSAAGARESGLVLPLPKSLAKKRTTLASDLRGLLAKELTWERSALPGEEPWSTSEAGERTSLVITDAGLAAVGLTGSEGVNLNAAARIQPKPSKVAKVAKTVARPKSVAKAQPRKAAGITTAKQPAAKAPARTTKLDLMVGALRSHKGATIDELMTLTGWQAHSVRGAISGALKKKLGLKVLSEAVEGKSRTYRIEGQASK
jgi:Protein of unknown function (DUF3489)